mmetsp:Transcript_46026/g.72742  ORF Transcript_46026/g.72742 Transcript_46026/m.72742 type:complete len:176 (+) Transcript_46026:43-570(+)
MPMPQSHKEKAPFRGKFQCQLCPNKILLSEKDMELHLQSGFHKKNEKRFNHAKELGIEAYEAECRARAEAREALAGKPSKRKLKNTSYWDKKRKKASDKKDKNRKSGKGSDKAPAQAEIERRKQAFQAKKARRLERRKAAEAAQDVPSKAAPEGNAASENSRERKKKRKKTPAAK